MARLGMENFATKDGPILVLNSGSSSLKFGIYYRVGETEKPFLTGSAEGIGKSDGTFQIRFADGSPTVTRKAILESQSDALSAVADIVRDHIHTTPVAIGHRVVHGGPALRTH